MKTSNLQLLSVLFALALINQSCGDDDLEKETVTRSIVGTWYIFTEGDSCKDIVTFKSDGTFTSNSNEEKLTGTYTFEETVTLGARHELSMHILSDNGLDDCDGNSFDGTGSMNFWIIDFESDSLGRLYSIGGFIPGTGSTIIFERKN